MHVCFLTRDRHGLDPDERGERWERSMGSWGGGGGKTIVELYCIKKLFLIKLK